MANTRRIVRAAGRRELDAIIEATCCLAAAGLIPAGGHEPPRRSILAKSSARLESEQSAGKSALAASRIAASRFSVAALVSGDRCPRRRFHPSAASSGTPFRWAVRAAVSSSRSGVAGNEAAQDKRWTAAIKPSPRFLRRGRRAKKALAGDFCVESGGEVIGQCFRNQSILLIC